MLTRGLRRWAKIIQRQRCHRLELCSTVAEENCTTSQIVQRIQEDRRIRSLTSSPAISENISGLLSLFPLAKVTVEQVVTSCPELLRFKPARIQEYCQIIAESGDHNHLSSEEALALLGAYPELLKWSKLELQSHLSELFGQTAEFLLPWNVVLLASPQLILYQPQAVAYELEKLLKYFSQEEMYHLLGNNPTLLDEPFETIEEKLIFLMKTMNVSAQRISQSRSSLTKPLHFYQLRYEFLLRSGNYQHPDHNQQGKKLVEAKPKFTLITCLPDRTFLSTCAPTLTMEEFIVFKALFDMERNDTKKNLMADIDDENEEAIQEEEKEFRGSYGKLLKSGKKKKRMNGKP